MECGYIGVEWLIGVGVSYQVHDPKPAPPDFYFGVPSPPPPPPPASPTCMYFIYYLCIAVPALEPTVYVCTLRC